MTTIPKLSQSNFYELVNPLVLDLTAVFSVMMDDIIDELKNDDKTIEDVLQSIDDKFKE